MPSFRSTDPVWSIIKAYEETCRALREIQSEITALQQKQSQLESQRSSQHAMLVKLSQPAKERVFNTFDVLQQIFVYAVEPGTYDSAKDFIYVDSSPYVLPTVFSVASVSSLWRNTALRSPKLWQRIGFSGECDLLPGHRRCILHRVECCLRRSFPLPLIIYWEDTEISEKETKPCCWAKSLFQVIALHSYRWQAAKLRLPLANYKSIFPLKMPKLETLVFGNVNDNPTDLVLGYMPSLRTLGLIDYGDLDVALPWDQLSTISATNPFTMVDSPLKNCKRLERLYIEPGEDGFAFEVPDPISLANLRHLSINSEPTDIPWSNLTMPALESFTIDHTHPYNQESDELHRFMERCPCLRLLQIRLSILQYNPTGQEAETLLDLFSSPTVHTLQLALVGLSENIHLLLSFLTLHQLKKQFPALRHIHVDVVGSPAPLGFEDVATHAVFALSHEIEKAKSICGAQSSLQMVHLHTNPSHNGLFPQIYPTSSHLRVTSTPLQFEWSGQSYFPFYLSEF